MNLRFQHEILSLTACFSGFLNLYLVRYNGFYKSLLESGKKMKNKKITALYCRISREDELVDVSSSIGLVWKLNSGLR